MGQLMASRRWRTSLAQIVYGVSTSYTIGCPILATRRNTYILNISIWIWVNMTYRLIRLSTAAMCDKCKKIIRHGRPAWWEAGSFLCPKCARHLYQEAEDDPEAEAMLSQAEDREGRV